MIGYKTFSIESIRENGFTDGGIYEIKEPLVQWTSGFHFYDVPIKVGSFEESTHKCAIIKVLGSMMFKDCTLFTNKIKILKFVTKEELLQECGDRIFEVPTGEYHFKNNLLHRDNDLPAMICENGNRIWYQNGKFKRENGLPTIVRYDGQQDWTNEDGQLHRDNGLPAVICPDGFSYHYKNGVRISVDTLLPQSKTMIKWF